VNEASPPCYQGKFFSTNHFECLTELCESASWWRKYLCSITILLLQFYAGCACST